MVQIRGEKRKTVVFNLDDPREAALYELASRVNFGRLVKGYLSQELQRITAQRGAAKKPAETRAEFGPNG